MTPALCHHAGYVPAALNRTRPVPSLGAAAVLALPALPTIGEGRVML